MTFLHLQAQICIVQNGDALRKTFDNAFRILHRIDEPAQLDANQHCRAQNYNGDLIL